MVFNFNIYALFLIFFGIFSFLLSFYIYKKQSGAVRFFGLMMFSNAIWSLGYGFELASPRLEQALFFIKMEYIGIGTLPLNWTIFCLKLSGKEHWYKKKFSIFILGAIAILTISTVWTNNYHHLYFRDYIMTAVEGINLVELSMGPGYWIFTIYFYLSMALGCLLLLAKFNTADAIYKRQTYSIIVAVLIPLVANFSYVSYLRPYKNLDVTPFAFTASILLISIAIYRFRLFDMVPVAREKVLDRMQDGFLVLDNKYRVIDHNYTLRKYLPDFKGRKLIGTPVEQLFPDQRYLSEFLKEHRAGKLELHIETKTDSFDLEADIGYLDENQKNNEATIIKFQDLTILRAESLRSKLQAEELKKLNDLKDRIFSIIAHDLRAPLVNLSEILKMLSTDQISVEEFKHLAPVLDKDIIYTTDLLENILHWSRSQLKGNGITREFFDLKSLIVNEVNYHKSAAQAKKIEIIQDVFPGAMTYADRLMIQIVVRNILSNAIKFCFEGGTIHITAVYADRQQIKLCLSDNGVGMSKEIVRKLFTGENHSTRGTMNEKGTGLGMVVCKEFVERNDGKLSVESEAGKGSKFCVYLPVDDKF
jgi:signal transduction histidine kinase